MVVGVVEGLKWWNFQKYLFNKGDRFKIIKIPHIKMEMKIEEKDKLLIRNAFLLGIVIGAFGVIVYYLFA